VNEIMPMTQQSLIFSKDEAPDSGSSAQLSSCKTYRYRLARWWGTEPRVGFLMLNPSKADHVETDKTLETCIRFAKAWGFDGLEIANLFAFRATDPRDMKMASDPVGPENDHHLETFLGEVNQVILAWGNNGLWRGRDKAVLELLRNKGLPLWCLKISAQGAPEHPLYKPASLRPIPFPLPPR